MNKKILGFMLVAFVLLSLTACTSFGDSGQDEQPEAQSAVANSAPVRQEEASVEQEEPGTKQKETEAQQEEAAHKITYSNVKTYTNSIGTTYAQVIVEIKNTGTCDLYLSSGSYDLEDVNGNLVATGSLVSTYPNVISPDEKAYMYDENMLDEAVSGELTVIPRPDVEKAKVEKIRYNVTDVEISESQFGYLKAMGRVENNTSEDYEGMIYVVIMLKDANNTPIGQIFTIISEPLSAGAKIGFEASAISLPDDVTADSVASYDVFAFPLQMQF